VSARQRRPFLSAVAALVLLTGCNIGIHAGVDLHRDGSGVVHVAVSFDDDAFRQVEGQLQTTDLQRSGWQVDGPHKEANGLTWVRASKSFVTPAQGEAVAAEIGRTLFRDLKLERHHTFFKTRTSFRWTVDFSGGTGALSDPALERQLAQSGSDAPTIKRRLMAAADRAIAMEVVARLPGTITSNAPASTSGGAVWKPKPGDRAATLIASSTSWNTTPIALAGAAVVLGLAGIVVLFRSLKVFGR
jgi:hypothetical protein